MSCTCPRKIVVTGNPYHLRVWIVLWKVLSNLTFAQALWSTYLPHFIDEETVSERLRDLSKVIHYAKLGLEPRSFKFQIMCSDRGLVTWGTKRFWLFFQKKRKKVFKLFLPGSAKIIFLTPSISKVANVVGRLEEKQRIFVSEC